LDIEKPADYMDRLIMDASSVNFPRWGDDVPFTVAEIHDGKEVVAYPDQAINQTNKIDGQQHLYPCNQLLIL
jgi:hypothetical protein